MDYWSPYLEEEAKEEQQAVIPAAWYEAWQAPDREILDIGQINLGDFIAWQQWEGYNHELRAILPVPLLPKEGVITVPLEEFERLAKEFGVNAPLVKRFPSEIHLWQLWLTLPDGSERGLQVPRSCTLQQLQQDILPCFDAHLDYFGVKDDEVFPLADQRGTVEELGLTRVRLGGPAKPLSRILGERTAGLVNLGNTCFMNSGLQCLLRVKPLVEYFLSGRYEKDLNEENPLGTGGQLARDWAKLLRAYFTAASNGAVSPTAFKWTLGRHESRFLGYSQQDSQELLSALLDRLHEDVNRVRIKPYTPIPDDLQGRTEQEIAQVSWELHLARNDSEIVKLFHGQYRSELVCPLCQTHSITMDPFSFLTLPLSTSRRTRKQIKYAAIVASAIRAGSEEPIMQRRRLPVSDHPKVADLRQAVKNEAAIVVEVFRSEIYAILPDHYLLNPEEEVVVYTPHSEGPHAWVTLCAASIGYSRPFGIPLLVAASEEDLSAQLALLFEALPSESIELRPMIADPDSPYPSFHAILPKSLLDRSFGPDADPHRAMMDLLNDLQEEEEEKAEEGGTVTEEQSRPPIQLEECLAAFRQPEQLSPDESWYCRQCKQHRQACKQMDLWRVPPYLFIHLKRFSQHGYLGHKITLPVQFPLAGLELGGGSYELIAISEHFGGLGGGHYTALGRLDRGQWCRFDDSQVIPVDAALLTSVEVQRSAYLLLYTRSLSM